MRLVCVVQYPGCSRLIVTDSFSQQDAPNDIEQGAGERSGADAGPEMNGDSEAGQSAGENTPLSEVNKPTDLADLRRRIRRQLRLRGSEHGVVPGQGEPPPTTKSESTPESSQQSTSSSLLSESTQLPKSASPGESGRLRQSRIPHILATQQGGELPALLYRRDLPRTNGPPRRRYEPRGPIVQLEDAAPGCETEGPLGGTVYVIEERMADRGSQWVGLCDSYRMILENEQSEQRRRLAGVGWPDCAGPSDVVFFDLETTGLSSTPLFLIGTMFYDGSSFVVRQYLARTYAEEQAAIALFLTEADDKKVLVSFNGKTYDVPYLRTRAAATGVPYRFSPVHIDLLHIGRRAWKGEHPDFKLQTLERRVCGRRRSGDIPGSEIPAVYHSFVRTGNAVLIAEVLKHNLLDLVTLADLLTRLPGPR